MKLNNNQTQNFLKSPDKNIPIKQIIKTGTKILNSFSFFLKNKKGIRNIPKLPNF